MLALAEHARNGTLDEFLPGNWVFSWEYYLARVRPDPMAFIRVFSGKVVLVDDGRTQRFPEAEEAAVLNWFREAHPDKYRRLL